MTINIGNGTSGLASSASSGNPPPHRLPHTEENTVHAYFDIPAGQIYHVMHHATGNRRAALLLCGPAGAERERSYPTLVRWARTLATNGCDTMRFDYRGIGESSGKFENMTISDWLEDAAFCAARLSEISPGIPLILQGTRAGALIASELFASGIGDGLLLWAPPASGHALLWDTLRRNLASQMVPPPGHTTPNKSATG